MSKIQVLITTMYQTDFSIAEAMNLQTDAIIANQADDNFYAELERDTSLIKLITTNTRGTSTNRNIAMAYISREAEYVMFSDDDLCFVNGYESLALNEFEKHPEAEAIMFSLENTSDWNLGRLQTDQFRRATRRSVTASGVWGLVIKKDVLLKHNLHFNQYFGPGTDAYSGEDTIFLQDIIKGGIRMYMSPVVIASIDQSTSTWFDGFTDKYYIVKGMVLAAAYPKLAPVLAVRSVYRMTRKAGCERSFRELRKLYFQGIKQFHKR